MTHSHLTNSSALLGVYNGSITPKKRRTIDGCVGSQQLYFPTPCRSAEEGVLSCG